MRYADTDSNDDSTPNDVLHDDCGDFGNGWVAPKGSIDDDANLIVDLVCPQKISSVILKNLATGSGGTKAYSIYLGYSLEGPWNLVTMGKLNESFSCEEDLIHLHVQKR